MIDVTPKLAYCIGKSGLGKSWLLGFLAAQIARPFVVILHVKDDPSYFGEQNGVRVSSEHVDRSTTRHVEIRRGSAPMTADFLIETRAKFRTLYLQFMDVPRVEMLPFIDSLCLAVARVGDLAIFLEESHAYAKPPTLPLELEPLMRGARSNGVDVFLAAHRPVDIHPTLRCVINYLIQFQASEFNDLKTLAVDMGLGQDVADTVRSLERFRFLFVNLDKNIVSPPAML